MMSWKTASKLCWQNACDKGKENRGKVAQWNRFSSNNMILRLDAYAVCDSRGSFCNLYLDASLVEPQVQHEI